jgi:hypothetical protein
MRIERNGGRERKREEMCEGGDADMAEILEEIIRNIIKEKKI